MTSAPAPAFFDAAQVESLLDLRGCIAAMREAMVALSTGGPAQPLRQILPAGSGGLFAVMPGDLPGLSLFGAKLVSVFGDPGRPGRTRHRGLVVCHDGSSGEVICVADAEAITRIRTACMTAAATDALARPDARTLAVFGTGLQAQAHLMALPLVRPFERVLVWGRSEEAANACARRVAQDGGVDVEVVLSAERAARQADVLCTVSGASEPIVLGEWVLPGSHINLVGSSYLGPVEVDTDLVLRSRYFADYLPSALAQAAELAVARSSGAVSDSHVVGEIGEVFSGVLPGREDAGQVTLYKSLGHAVQDLAAAAYILRHARGEAS